MNYYVGQRREGYEEVMGVYGLGERKRGSKDIRILIEHRTEGGKQPVYKGERKESNF